MSYQDQSEGTTKLVLIVVIFFLLFSSNREEEKKTKIKKEDSKEIQAPEVKPEMDDEDGKKAKADELKAEKDQPPSELKKDTEPTGRSRRGPKPRTEAAKVQHAHDFGYRLLVTSSGLVWCLRDGSFILLSAQSAHPTYKL